MRFSAQKVNKKKNVCNHRGFTLIEVIVSVAVFTLILIGLSAFILALYRGNAFALQESSAIQGARKGVTELAQYLREANYSEEGAYPIVEAGTSSITFYSDTNRDGKIEKVRYFMDGTDLKQGVTEPSGNPPTYTATPHVRVVSRHVRNLVEGVPLFTYYSDTGQKLVGSSDIADITFISAQLILNVDPVRAPKDFSLRSSTALRNLKTNL